MSSKRAPTKVKYLKDNNGSWAYRRRVPERHHSTLGFKTWNKPCGKVPYPDAVVKVAGWTKEHDELIAQLDDPKIAAGVREVTISGKWERTAHAMRYALEDYVRDPEARMHLRDEDGNIVDTFDALPSPWVTAREFTLEADENSDPVQRLVVYRIIKNTYFDPIVVPPTDPDERDQYDAAKRMLERRIADLNGDPNTISVVSEKAFDFARIKTQVRKKYRRSIQQLIDHAGDIPLPHLTGAKLREFREAKTGSMKASSVQSVFTPIRTMMKFAVENEIIENNPMPDVSMPRETRSVCPSSGFLEPMAA
ncbi:hypothetical protein FTO60_05090 [Octadecabacter sp. SW4]|uniref:phage integrase SAM-like domain-containing protein n=1 Tax=Octadecabacter sp. SW4 TaxID=2602067 RepID=UPI0011C1EE8C|nr:phage integrase SAM-like domain-containing protein [Octadecabacter sp. SW4]QEE35141.1 hypothetical protein FTO60_05090 [Octadecabacter sp. SW4]